MFEDVVAEYEIEFAGGEIRCFGDAFYDFDFNPGPFRKLLGAVARRGPWLDADRAVTLFRERREIDAGAGADVRDFCAFGISGC